MSEKVLKFHPSIDGFQFTNSWQWEESDLQYMVSEIEPTVNAALATVGAVAGMFICGLPCAAAGAIALGVYSATGGAEQMIRGIAKSQTTYGMCGGMVQAATDYWLMNWLIPGGTATPKDATPEGQVLRAYIRERLADTLKARLFDFLKFWLIVKESGNVPRAPLRKELTAEYQKIKDSINRGIPVTIGLVGDAPEPWDMHQVLCYGYQDTAEGGRLYIYDPNQPRTDIWIKLDIRQSLGDRCEITTNMPTGTSSDGSVYIYSQKNKLGYLFMVDYVPKTPPQQALTAGALRLSSADGKPRYRKDVPAEMEVDITYHSIDKSIEFTPYLVGRTPQGTNVDVGDAASPVRNLSGTQTAVWPKKPLPGPVGQRTLTLKAHLTQPSHPFFSGQYECFKEIPAASGGDVSATVYMHDLPGVGNIGWNFTGDVPQQVPGQQQLYYPLALTLVDALGQNTLYTWSLSGTNAGGTITGSGKNVSAQVTVDPSTPTPSQISIKVEGIDPNGNESVGSAVVPLPRARLSLTVSLQGATPWGMPKMRHWQNNQIMAKKGALYQAYAAVFVELEWHNLVGPPTSIEWVLSDTPLAFSASQIPQQGNVLRIPVSLVGNNDPRFYYMQGAHDPQDVVLRCTVTDAAGQRVSISRKISVWYPVSEYMTGPAVAENPNQVFTSVVEVLDRVRERLAASAQAPLPEPRVGVGPLGDLLREDLAGLAEMDLEYPSEPDQVMGIGLIGLEETVLRVGGSDRFPLAEEAALEFEAEFNPEVEVASEIGTAIAEVSFMSDVVAEASEAASPATGLVGSLVPGEWTPMD